MKRKQDNIVELFKRGWQQMDRLQREKATALLEKETAELEKIFTISTASFFYGLPSPPMHISLELLPFMEHEISHMINQADRDMNPLSELFSNLDAS